MDLERRIEAFIELGNRIKFISPDDYRNWVSAAKNNNSWFSDQNIETAFEGIVKLMDGDNLKKWLGKYSLKQGRPKKVGVVMAGNIPMVGFHDFLSVLISGHILYAKLSSQDNVLIKKVAAYLIDIEKEFKDKINFVEKINDMDAVIATGSDNTAKYFHYYFSKIPHIIRQNRASCAVLAGNETEEDLTKLGKDILQYYGMGCRNVSKVYVPQDYDFIPLLKSLESHRGLVDNHKFYNNYDYNKSIYLLNQVPHYDNGFLMFTQEERMVSPISVVYYEYYSNETDLKSKLETHKNKIQVIVSKQGNYPGSIDFGEAQFPSLWDYADGVDTMEFLNSI